MTTRTALGWPVHPLRAQTVCHVADINTHGHHISIGCIANASAVRESLFFVVSR